MPPGDNRHLAPCGLDFSKQRHLLLGRPLPAPLDPRHDLYIRQTSLLLELQKESPEDAQDQRSQPPALHVQDRTLTLQLKERPFKISGKIKIDTYRAGFVEAITPFLEQLKALRTGTVFAPVEYAVAAHDLAERIAHLKAAYHVRTAVECSNLVMDSPNYGIDLIIQRMIGMNTYSLNILYGEIGTGATAPSLADTALASPTNRAAVGFQQDYGSTDAVFQFFFSDSQLADQTYNEFGTFVDGTSTIGSGQIFNHAILSPAYEKISGQDTTIQCAFSFANS